MSVIVNSELFEIRLFANSVNQIIKLLGRTAVPPNCFPQITADVTLSRKSLEMEAWLGGDKHIVGS